MRRATLFGGVAKFRLVWYELTVMGIGFIELLILGVIPLGGFVCWILVVIAAFQKEPTPKLGVAALVLGILTLGLGTFVLGWVKARQWRIVPTMAAWSMLLLSVLLLPVSLYFMLPKSAPPPPTTPAPVSTPAVP